jgi:two-component system, chemotaxis family, chemotaxis protein CheY
MRAMIVDDSRAMRTIVRRILTECGYDDIAEAADGREALDLLGEGPPPALALVDWNMPVMNGLEFVIEARREPAWNEMVIVMITTETAIERITDALSAGANEYVMKPFTRESLLEKLEVLQASDTGLG